MSSLSDYLAEPVTPERRAWWREATRQMDEMRALHAARDAEAQRWVDAVPPARRLAPLIPHDYSLAAAPLRRGDGSRSGARG